MTEQQSEQRGEPSTAETPATAHTEHKRLSPVLLIFLIFPVIGLVAALLLLNGEPGNANRGLPTPAAVTLPPMPTPIDLANTPIIDFQLTSFDGELVRAQDYIGRVIFLNFWATWCEPCKREMPTFSEFMAMQPEDGAVVLAVSVEDRRVDVETFLNEHGIDNLNVLMDTSGDTADQFGVFQLPVTYVIDVNGVIRYPKYGEITLAELNAYTEALQAERSS